MFGTKWPSITSRCRKSAPPPRTASISDPSLEKSAERIDGRIGRAVVLTGSWATALIQAGQCRGVAAFPPPQRPAAAGAEVADALGEPHLLAGRGAVAAADDG